MSDDQTRFQSSSSRSSGLQAFFIVVVPAADIMLDYPRYVIQYFYPAGALFKKRKQRSFVFFLTDGERLQFILGVAIQAVAYYIPSQLDISTSFFVKMSITHCSTCLTLGPLVLFLSRCTDTFTSVRAFILVLTLGLGHVMYTITYFFRDDINIVFKLRTVANILVLFAFTMFALLTLLCLGEYICGKIENCPLRKILHNYFNSTESEDKKKVYYINEHRSNELYLNYVPALHMVCLMTMAFAKVYVRFVANNDLKAAENAYIVSLTTAIIVLVIELRIRKNEVTRGLIELLASKMSYVRYISHELRTPLNTAFLGQKLLTSDMKVSKCPKDIDRYDTLCDVNMSCMAAVDILNDLLCYEKLESGILDLHKSNVVVVPFLSECVSMFAAQARECDVTMTLVTDMSHLSSKDSNLGLSYALQPHDAIFVDKFKIDQVIRNLMSNALKFTPRGGGLTVQATFLPDAYTEPVTVIAKPPSIMTRIRSYIMDAIQGWKKMHIPAIPHQVSLSDGVDVPLVGKLLIVVTDTGAAISTENQKRLFKDIGQLSPEKLQAGGDSGLGMWITGGIVDLHGGKISVYSEGEGSGSSFTVELPMKRVSLVSEHSAMNVDTNSVVLNIKSEEDVRCEYKDDLYKENPSFQLQENSSFEYSENPSHFPKSRRNSINVFESSSTTSSDSSIPSFDVLVVDGSRLNRMMLLKCLQSDKHVCTEAEDGIEAVMKVKERMDLNARGIGRPYDEISMNFIMPNMDGPTAAAKIREMGYTEPIFGVTGNGLPSDIAHFLSCGAGRVLLKPLNIEALDRP